MGADTGDAEPRRRPLDQSQHRLAPSGVRAVGRSSAAAGRVVHQQRLRHLTRCFMRSSSRRSGGSAPSEADVAQGYRGALGATVLGMPLIRPMCVTKSAAIMSTGRQSCSACNRLGRISSAETAGSSPSTLTCATGRLEQTQQDLDHGGLAGAVRTTSPTMPGSTPRQMPKAPAPRPDKPWSATVAAMIAGGDADGLCLPRRHVVPFAVLQVIRYNPVIP